MNHDAQPGPNRVRITGGFDRATWDNTADSVEIGDVLIVSLASHIEEIYDALTDTYGRFGDAVAWIEARIKAGTRLALFHEVNAANVRWLPDFVRFFDDRFRDSAGIIFDSRLKESDAGWIRPWWQAAYTALVERECGWEAPPLAWWPDGHEGALRPRAVVEEFPAAPEDCVVMATGPGGVDVSEAVSTILAKLGGFERFIHPSRLDLPEDLLARYCAEEPRDEERVHREVREEPWVLFTLGGSPSIALAKELLIAAKRVHTVPHVALRHSNEDSTGRYLSDLRRLCDDEGVPLLTLQDEAPASDVALEAALDFDFVVHVGRGGPRGGAQGGAVCGMWGLLPDEHRRGLEARLREELPAVSRETKSRPLSAWHRHLLGHYDGWGSAGSLFQQTVEGSWIDLKSTAAADFWIQECSEPSMILGSTDPVPMDRFLVDSLGIEVADVPYLSTAIDCQYVYALHEGVRLSGDAPPERVLGRAKPRLKRVSGKPLTILGVASTTLQNHSASLLVDGQIVAAAQEERLRRRKQLGWHPPNKPGATVVSDGTIPLDRAYPWRSIRAVLAEGGLAFEDVDIVALNGIPSRFFDTYSLTDPARPPITICHDDFVFVPHHLSHAASAYRVSGFDDAFVFTVDGRGERETAAFFETRDGELHRVFDVLCHEDSLIGGVYEFITTILGFGHHGQGSTMGLAPMGKPTIAMSDFLSAQTRTDYAIHDRGIMEAFGHLMRERNGPLEQVHFDLAASVQKALEDTVIRFIEDGLQGRDCENLCLAGGVTLNCSMNQRIRSHFGLKRVFAQPAAHDAGTSLGAALEAHWLITGEAVPTVMNHANLGPTYGRDDVLQALNDYGVPYCEPEDMADTVAGLIADQSIVCRFQGRSEFGPRALGARSILADPRSAAIKARLNTLKGRQWWRPFGPSILAGHESDYFKSPHVSPFMLFTLAVREEKLEAIPAVLHVDGTTRPQSVTKEANGSYHRLIERFYQKTGVPMVVNTSFNTAFEPIVETPRDAVATFLQVGADYLAIEDFLVWRGDVEGLR